MTDNQIRMVTIVVVVSVSVLLALTVNVGFLAAGAVYTVLTTLFALADR